MMIGCCDKRSPADFLSTKFRRGGRAGRRRSRRRSSHVRRRTSAVNVRPTPRRTSPQPGHMLAFAAAVPTASLLAGAFGRRSLRADDRSRRRRSWPAAARPSGTRCTPTVRVWTPPSRRPSACARQVARRAISTARRGAADEGAYDAVRRRVPRSPRFGTRAKPIAPRTTPPRARQALFCGAAIRRQLSARSRHANDPTEEARRALHSDVQRGLVHRRHASRVEARELVAEPTIVCGRTNEVA